MNPPVRYQSKMSVLRFATERTFSRSVTKPNSILMWYLTGRAFIYRMDEVRTANFKPDQYNSISTVKSYFIGDGNFRFKISKTRMKRPLRLLYRSGLKIHGFI